ncbi:hypothetical protein ABK040_015991 [Willaertia magna]
MKDFKFIVPVTYWDTFFVTTFIKQIQNINSESLLQTVNHNLMTSIAFLFEYHCITGLDLLEITVEDVKEILSTTLSDVEKEEEEQENNNIVKARQYINNYLLESDEIKTIDRLANDIYLLIHAHLNQHLKQRT